MGWERSFSWLSLLVFPSCCHLTRVTVSKLVLAKAQTLSSLDAQGFGQANRRELTECWGCTGL